MLSLKKVRQVKKSILYSVLGVLLGLGAPVGSFLLRLVTKGVPAGLLWPAEWGDYSFFYVYMALGTTTAFGLFGYFLGAKSDALSVQNIRFSSEAHTDPLTGLANHRFLHEVFKVEFRKHLQNQKPISCLMMDLDHFKRINDRYGHPFGDFVLKHFASLIKKSVREGDMAARYGGEEFLCILPNCPPTEARAVAERIRKETANYPFKRGKKRIRLTVSVGVVTSFESSGLNYRQLIGLSDQALYEAKHRGRNQVIQATIRQDEEPPALPEKGERGKKRA